jgi:hypothetical protein
MDALWCQIGGFRGTLTRRVDTFLPLASSATSRWEHIALLPSDPAVPAESLLGLLRSGGLAFTSFLQEFGLAPLWHLRLSELEGFSQVEAACRAALQEARLAAAAKYLAQRDALRELDAIFLRAGIAHAIMKGPAIRELIHDDPSVLVASDLDILVMPEDRLRAVAALSQAGFQMRLDPVNISHEVLLRDSRADIDLHWHILRPGRTRTALTEQLLARRERRGECWTLSDLDCTFLMLVHPAFSKYVCSQNMGLARVMSFLLWHERVRSHWNEVRVMLDQNGLNWAAWAMLGWYATLAPTPLRPQLVQWRNTLKTGFVRSAYLDFWLQRNLPSRFIGHAFLIQLGFTTFLHDRPSDAWAAYKGWYFARLARSDEADAFRAAVPLQVRHG